ncbi:MAG: hypothetical protein JO107_11715, partial [Hyphomicrobiales bacterium]|nr:hypothetical protein [Hyphomicrobiales bacterium]
GGNIFAWLFGGQRGGGADDDEEGGGSEASATGRGARTPSGATEVASAEPDAVVSAQRNLPRGATYVQPAQPAPAVVAANDADAANDAGPVSLRGPIAAQFIAPTPPRKPMELAIGALAEADAPTPPQRPAEFAFAAAPAPGGAGNRDLIAALLERGRLPGVITRGMRGAPPDVLALAEIGPPEPPERPALLERAAALTAPLPPARPSLSTVSAANGSSTQPKTVEAANVPPSAPHGLAMLTPGNSPRQPASPYGDLVFDGFATGSKAEAPQPFGGLRGSAF